MAKIVKIKSELKESKNKSLLYTIFSLLLSAVFICAGVGLFTAIGLKKIDIPYVFPILFILLGIVMIIIYAVTHKKFDILNAGVKGEKSVLTVLKQLPANYTVITNPVVQTRGKIYELDFIVVGSNGVFVIESKNYNGLIEGKTSSQKWKQTKFGKNDKTYEKDVKNAVRQVNRQKSKLRELFIDLGINVHIYPVIYFSSKSIRIEIEDDAELNIPIIKEEKELLSYITETRSKKPISSNNYRKILRTLKN